MDYALQVVTPKIKDESFLHVHLVNLLFLSTPVGPLGSGLGGGVELTLKNIAIALQQRGHHIHVVAPQGSQLDSIPLTAIPGALQVLAQSQSRETPIQMPCDAVLARMWDHARQVQQDYDLLLNFAYDWLPFYLTPWLRRPVAHLVSMGSLSDAMDQAIAQTLGQFPHTIGVHTQAQADTFPFSDFRILQNGFDLSQYGFQSQPVNELAWVGRIAPEKGLEDAIAAAAQCEMPLNVFGAVSDDAYWRRLQQQYPDAPMRYRGFLPLAALQREVGQCKALLVTPKWIEAFGNVVVEALACGVPVVAYRRGGPAELVEHGQTGWLVEPDSVEGLVAAIAQVEAIERAKCRQKAEEKYSLRAMGQRVDAWVSEIVNARHVTD
ncbi:MAG: glycosyltransferase family 4 protein [Elainellaceae cyanobacterium]